MQNNDMNHVNSVEQPETEKLSPGVQSVPQKAPLEGSCQKSLIFG